MIHAIYIIHRGIIMNHQFDTVIIGAGPAGTSCGIALQKKNHNVCVIDKAVFPRNKTCAGLVTGKTDQLIGTIFDKAEIDGLFCCKADRIKLYRKTELLTETRVKIPAKIVNRIDFDNALVSKYKSLGGNIKEGEHHLSVDYKKSCVTLSNGDIIRYKHIVFADGALSLSHKEIGVDKRKMAFGIETYIPSDQFSTDSVDLYFDCINKGYLWVFPHGDTVCVGVANMFNKSTDYKSILTDFLHSVGVDPEKQKYTGAFLPYGYVIPQEKLPANVILVGDAGGFTDPITGEGLYMALHTGMLAAEAICSGNVKTTYLESVKPVVSIVKKGKTVQNLFFLPAVQKLFLKKVAGKEKLVSFYYDNLVDEYHYDYRRIGELLKDHRQYNKS